MFQFQRDLKKIRNINKNIQETEKNFMCEENPRRDDAESIECEEKLFLIHSKISFNLGRKARQDAM